MLDIPRDTKLVEAVDDDVNKMESMILEDPDIPLNMRLVHLQNQGGDDIIGVLENGLHSHRPTRAEREWPLESTLGTAIAAGLLLLGRHSSGTAGLPQ